MWGNRLGWGISVVLVLLMSGLVWLMSLAAAMSPPTAFSLDVSRFAAPQLSVAPATLVPSMTDDCDAAEHYRSAITEYAKNPDLYTDFTNINKVSGEAVENLTAVEPVVEGTHCTKMTLFASSPAEIVNYKTEGQRPALDALWTVGNVCIRLGFLSKEPADALKYYRAAFSLGSKLFAEHMTYAEMSRGLGLMSGAAAGMKNLAGKTKDTELEAAAQRFIDSYLEANKGWMNTEQTIASIDQRTLEAHAGDIFAIARNEQADRMWRVEAILQTGRYRFNAGRAGDQRGAMSILRKLANDPDSAIRAAAVAARDMTESQYNMMGR